MVMATDGGDGVGDEFNWEHVSVSLAQQPNKTPTWAEMCLVKDLFWNADECVVQFHVPSKDHVNIHNGCLHLWRNKLNGFPMPPAICV